MKNVNSPVKKIKLVFICLVILGVWGWAVENIPVTTTPPVIDGILNEPVWSHAFKLDNFKTFEPDYGKSSQQVTKAYITYDSENLYIGFQCYDNEPSKVKGSITKRDNMFDDDWVALLIDTFNDKQSGYAFFVNPYGVQGDGMMNSAGNFNDSHDMVWDSKGRMNKAGYSAELRIPLKSIRFPAGEKITMRVACFRQLVRYSEMSSSPGLDPEKGSIISQSCPVSFKGLKYQRLIEILPAFTYNNQKEHQNGALKNQIKDSDLSLTGKLGITSDLVLDATINPDFSQIEADAGQVDVNLRYDLFYPEKRPFFLEGNELFEFAGNTESAPLTAIVHTRRIINPHVGFKLTGKLGRKNTIAALYSKDNIVDEDGQHLDPDFTIFRVRHALKDDSHLGGFFARKDGEDNFNQVFGMDGRLRLSSISLAEFHLLGSVTKKTGSSQTDPEHALGIKYDYSTRDINVTLGIQDISKEFKVDTGFVTRTGITRLALFSMYTFFPQSKFFQRIEPFYWSFHIYDKFSNMWETFNLFTVRFKLPKSTQVRFDGILANEIFEGQRFNRSGMGIQFTTQLSKKIALNIFARSSNSIYYDSDQPYQGYGVNLSMGLNYQPVEKLNTNFSLVYSDFYRNSTHQKVYDYGLIRNRTTFQVNKKLFFRGILEYNSYYKKLSADILASFTYIPGTVLYLGYGSVFEKLKWENRAYLDGENFLEVKRGFFFKISYLFRL